MPTRALADLTQLLEETCALPAAGAGCDINGSDV